MIEIQCFECGKSFSIYPNQLKKKKKFCSRKCAEHCKKFNPHLYFSEEGRAKIIARHKGKIIPQDVCIKMSDSQKRTFVEGRVTWCQGKHLSKETCQKISRFHKGHKYFAGKKHSAETRAKMSQTRKKMIAQGFYDFDVIGKRISKAVKGRVSAFKGKKHTIEAKIKIGIASKKKVYSPDFISNMRHLTSGVNNGMFGKHHSEESKKKMHEIRSKLISEGKLIFLLGEKHPCWRGGSTPYPVGWNEAIKKMIRSRDGFVCRICRKTAEQDGRELSVHHIDYNKNNLNPENLISLCKKCHVATNIKREAWKERFAIILSPILVEVQHNG